MTLRMCAIMNGIVLVHDQATAHAKVLICSQCFTKHTLYLHRVKIYMYLFLVNFLFNIVFIFNMSKEGLHCNCNANLAQYILYC